MVRRWQASHGRRPLVALRSPPLSYSLPSRWWCPRHPTNGTNRLRRGRPERSEVETTAVRSHPTTAARSITAKGEHGQWSGVVGVAGGELSGDTALRDGVRVSARLRGVRTLALVWFVRLPLPALGRRGFFVRPSACDAAREGNGEWDVNVEDVDGRREEVEVEGAGEFAAARDGAMDDSRRDADSDPPARSPALAEDGRRSEAENAEDGRRAEEAGAEATGRSAALTSS